MNHIRFHLMKRWVYRFFLYLVNCRITLREKSSTIETSANHQPTFYKADKRLYETNKDKEAYSLFDKANPSKSGFGKLCFFDDIFLTPGRGIISRRSEGVQQILLPLAGTLSYNDISNADQKVTCEEALYLPNKEGSHFIQNNHEKETINYLHIGLRDQAQGPDNISSRPISLKQGNELVTISQGQPGNEHHLSLGVYKGRTKGRYSKKTKGHGIFVFVVNGVFNVEGRLMEHRDGLALWDTQEIEFEALSEHATLLVMELPLN